MEKTTIRRPPLPLGAKQIWVTALVGATALGLPALTPAAGAQTPEAQAAPVTTTAYSYGPGPEVPACTRGQVQLAISLPHGNYFGGSPVPFKVRMTNVSPRACSVTALQPPSGVATELVYVRIFHSDGRRVLIPGGPPGLRARMLPRSLASHQIFSYTCTWNGRTWAAGVNYQPSGLLGAPAGAGKYTAVAVLADPALQTKPLLFILKAH